MAPAITKTTETPAPSAMKKFAMNGTALAIALTAPQLLSKK